MDVKRPHGRNLRKARVSQVGLYYFLTASVAGRREIFIESQRADIVLNAIRWVHDTRRFCVDAAVVMPDHLHLAGQLGKGSLSEVMHTLKSYTANRIANTGVATPIWQRGFYDHTLRDDDDYRTKVRYLIENPLRARLVSRIEDYPYMMLPPWWCC